MRICFACSKVIGRGNFGQVYSGTFGKQRLQVAVKELIVPEYCSEVEDIEQLVTDWKDEVEICMLLDHKNLIKTLGYITSPPIKPLRRATL